MTDQTQSQWDGANKNTVTATNVTPTINSRHKPNLVLDFDGVIHSYENGWQGGEIYGTVVQGFWEWAEIAKKYFTLVIYSSRSSSHKTRQPMEDWFKIQLQGWLWDNEAHGFTFDLRFEDFTFALYKVPAFLSIDDRAITFNGKWNDPQLDPQQLLKFKPWMEIRG